MPMQADQEQDHVTLADIPADRLFATPPEAADVLRVDPRSIRKALASGQIPSVRVGPQYRIPMAWLRAHAAGPSDGGRAGDGDAAA